MKYFLLIIAFSLFYTCEGKKQNFVRPDLCALLDDYPKNSVLLGQMSVKDLIVLQKCGLNYHPHFLFGYDIAHSNEYPVPEVLAALKDSGDDEFSFELIEILIQIAQSEKHAETIRKDKRDVLLAVDDALDTMRDTEFTRIARKERQKLASVLD
jgi:hypothetical protein